MLVRNVDKVCKETAIALTVLVMICHLILVSSDAHAMPPICESPTSDSDNDGWGWENGASCVVADGPSAARATATVTTNYCLYRSSDDDSDGWGWENNASCRIGPDSSDDQPIDETEDFEPVVGANGRLVCQSEDADPDGDGFGWENNASCVVPGSDAVIETSRAPNPFCTTDDADPDGDGWGWENNASCIAVAPEENDTETINTVAIDDDSSEPTVRNETGPNDGDDTEITDSSDTEITDNSDTDTTGSTDTETTDSIDTEITDSIDTETTDSIDTEITDSSDTEITDSSDTEITDSIDTDTTTSVETELTDSTKTSATDSDWPDDTTADAVAYLPSDITDLILVTGQSNTLGSNSSVDSALDAPHPRVFAYTSNGWDVAALFQSWDNGAHPGTGDPTNTQQIHNNFALHFGKRLAALDENAVIGFILVSEPGEGIDHWRPGNTGMLRVQQKTLEAINALPHKAAIDGILWHQGETDWILEGTSDPDVEQPAPVDYYPVRLNRLIENFRLENWYDSDKPFICGETIQALGVNTHLNSLNSDGDINTVCVEGAGLAAINEDGSHFNAPSLRTLGRRYAEAYDLLR